MLKAELHCHIEGAADPALIVRLSKKYNIDLSDIIQNNSYVWSDFTSFLNCYDRASSVLRQPEDYRLLAYDYFCKLAEQKCIYGEIFASPDHASLMGIGYLDLIDALAKGIEDAKAEWGIEGRIIVTCVRHLGPAQAENVAEQAANNPHPMVTGFGMGGDERLFTMQDFAPAFDIAADAKLGLTVHAGEFAGPESIKDALDHLNVSRIGHGVRCIEDPVLVDRLIHDDIALEVCPASNIALNVYPDFASHPFKTLMHRGMRLCLNSDDPPFFHTNLQQEYDIARDHFGCSQEALYQCTRTAIEAAFVDEPTRQKLLTRLRAEKDEK